MAFLQPQSSDPWIRQPVFRAPAVVVSLIAILIAAHGARVLMPPGLSAELVNQFAFIPARYSHAFLATHNVDPGGWLARGVPFVSYMALHNDFTHLAINSLWLLAFGPVPPPPCRGKCPPLEGCRPRPAVPNWHGYGGPGGPRPVPGRGNQADRAFRLAP